MIHLEVGKEMVIFLIGVDKFIYGSKSNMIIKVKLAKLADGKI